MNFKMTDENQRCPYFAGCSLRLELPFDESCYGKQVIDCIRYRTNGIREVIEKRISDRRSILRLLTGNV